MDNQIKSKRRKRQKQIKDLIKNFEGKHPIAPKVSHYGKLIEQLLRKAKDMSPALMEELITLKHPQLLKDLIGEENVPEDELLPEDYFLGEINVENGVREKIGGIRIEEVIGNQVNTNPLLKDEDLEALLYAITYVLAGPAIANSIPCYGNPSTAENRQSQQRTSKPAKR